MTNIVVTSNVVAAVVAETLASGDTLTEASGFTIASTGGNGIVTAGSTSLTIDGLVTGQIGILAGQGGGTTTLNVGVNGHVTSYAGNGLQVIGTANISNNGTIDTAGAADAIFLNASGANDHVNFTNTGIISATSSSGAAINYVENSSNTYTFFNTGTVNAQSGRAYYGHVGVDSIVNKGTMQGIIELGTNNDLYDGRNGVVTGNVNGGAGNDSLYGGASQEHFFGGDDNDTIDGGGGVDLLSGDDGNDTITFSIEDGTVDGGNGQDTAINGNQLYGAAGGFDINQHNFESYVGSNASEVATSSSNSVAGSFSMGGGDDYVFGGNGADGISGGTGNDNLIGNGGNDTIAGDNGDDRIEGQAGADTLTGGQGKDTFVYRGPFDGGDTITDFAIGFDTLEIQRTGFLADPATMNAGALDPNRFVRGPASLATGQFLFDTNAGFLYWDADGTGGGAATLIAQLSNVHTLSAADFRVV